MNLVDDGEPTTTVRICLLDGQIRILQNVPKDASITLSKEGIFRVSKPGVFSGKWDLAVLFGVTGYHMGELSMGKPEEKRGPDWVDPGNEEFPAVSTSSAVDAPNRLL